MLQTFLDTLFPIFCLVCQREGPIICAACLAGLNHAQSQRCIVCGKESSEGVTHSWCASPLTPLQSISLFDYGDPTVARIITLAKYKFLPSAFSLLSQNLANFAERVWTNTAPFPNAIIPIPIAPSRQRWRGFNQTQILATTIATTLRISNLYALTKPRHTKPQKGLTKEQRLTNLEAVFSVENPTPIYGYHLILVDDVITTGATLREAAAVLLDAGATSVRCLTLAQD